MVELVPVCIGSTAQPLDSSRRHGLRSRGGWPPVGLIRPRQMDRTQLAVYRHNGGASQPVLRHTLLGVREVSSPSSCAESQINALAPRFAPPYSATVPRCPHLS